MKNVNKRIVFGTVIFVAISIIFQPTPTEAEIIHNKAGKITNLIIDGNNAYFFEVDTTIKSSTWIPDTRVYEYSQNGIRLVSDILFMFPMELIQDDTHLYFSKLSDSCEGSTMCDYQDIVKMSKKNGSFEIIAQDLKSAIRMSLEDEGLYVSESSGKIWQYSGDGPEATLIYEGDNLIMDITSEDDETVYWIEEISDQQSIIKKMEKDSKAKTIQDDLQIPYDLKDDHGLFWNEIYLNQKEGSLAEYTKMTEHKDSKNTIIGNYKNTIPLGKQSGIHHGPYLVIGDYLLISNNTNKDSTIQLHNIETSQTIDIQNVDYNIEFMDAAEDSLYVVGTNEEGFLIEKIDLPVTVPEFSTTMVLIASVGITTLLLLKTPYQIRKF